MTSDSDAVFVSIVGMNYLHPMAAILERALAKKHVPPNTFQTAPIENGYSIALVVLCALLAEPAIRRTQYVLDDFAERNPLKFIHNRFPNCEVLAELTELFVQRDVIAHNHVREASVKWGRHGEFDVTSTAKLSGGDRKYEQVIDLTSNTTKALRLNLFPPKVNLCDVAIAMSVTQRFLQFPEDTDRRYFYVSPQIVEFKGALVEFSDLLSAAEESIRAA